MPPCESDSEAETTGAWGGQKCSVIKQLPPTRLLTPCLGLQKQDRLPQRTLPFCQPRGLLQTTQEFGIGIRQGLQLGGEFLPSFVSSTYCLALASQCSLSGSVVLPAQCFDIVFAQGQGSCGLWHLSLTGNELQTVIIIKVNISTAVDSNRKTEWMKRLFVVCKYANNNDIILAVIKKILTINTWLFFLALYV